MLREKKHQTQIPGVSFLLRIEGVYLVFAAGRQHNMGFRGAMFIIDLPPYLGELFPFSPEDLERVF